MNNSDLINAHVRENIIPTWCDPGLLPTFHEIHLHNQILLFSWKFHQINRRKSNGACTAPHLQVRLRTSINNEHALLVVGLLKVVVDLIDPSISEGLLHIS